MTYEYTSQEMANLAKGRKAANRFKQDTGLVGVEIHVKEYGPNRNYPWDEEIIPVKITAEYPNYICGVVLPHVHTGGYGISREYPVTISKIDLVKGIVKIMY